MEVPTYSMSNCTAKMEIMYVFWWCTTSSNHDMCCMASAMHNLIRSIRTKQGRKCTVPAVRTERTPTLLAHITSSSKGLQIVTNRTPQ